MVPLLVLSLPWLFPSSLFRYHIEANGIHLYADTPFSPEAAQWVLARTHQRMQTVPDWKPCRGLSAFICNTTWRRRLFMIAAPQAGGIATYFRPHAFFSGADLDTDTLIKADGAPVTDERRFSYFLAHEFTHIHHERSVGIWHFHRTPDWIKEGYADFVGRGNAWQRPEAIEGFLNNSPLMTEPRIAPYLRYNLLFAFHHHILEQSIDDLSKRAPTRDAAEAALTQFLREPPHNR